MSWVRLDVDDSQNVTSSHMLVLAAALYNVTGVCRGRASTSLRSFDTVPFSSTCKYIGYIRQCEAERERAQTSEDRKKRAFVPLGYFWSVNPSVNLPHFS
ncbi:unnamed protein product [Pleuronectes platessa]|uniref:Uncharacterized protein n=1 Tax=Pleuronectes platessa TaxID=8262 RepID=A0A9N7TPE1_PLEPL|nr:unnamed protein product [Pleuronectes platessa]